MNYYTQALSKYAVFSGRSRRAEYWTFTCTTLIISMMLNILQVVLFSNSLGMTDFSSPLSMLSTLFTIVMFVPGMSVAVRRLHDVGNSGWWVLISLIPFVGLIILFLFLIRDSEAGDNMYGPNPKGMSGTNNRSNSSNTDSMSGGFPTSAPTIQ